MPVMKVGPGRALLYSGIVAWDPSQPTTDGGLLPEHWYRSDGPLWQDAGVTPAVLDGDVIGRWEDLTANADHVNQAVAGNKPTLQNAAGDLLNGHPVVRGDSLNDYVRGTFTTGGAIAQPFTVFGVTKRNSWVANDFTSRTFIDDSAGVLCLMYARNNDDPDKWAIHYGALQQGNATNGNWNIWTVLANGATGQLWHNGISQVVGNVGANAMAGITVFNNFAGAQAWDGDATEILVYSANPSNADKNQIGQYLGTRYGLAYTDI